MSKVQKFIDYLKRKPASLTKLVEEGRDLQKADLPMFLERIIPSKAAKKYNKAVSHVDERLGELVTRYKGGDPKWYQQPFVVTEKVPHPKEKGLYISHKYPTLTGPTSKAAKFGAPVLAGMKAEELLGLDEPGQTKKANQSFHNVGGRMANYGKLVQIPEDKLVKTAAAIRQQGAQISKLSSEKNELEKRANSLEEAEKLAFQMVQKGVAKPFEDYEEFQEKVAYILNEGAEKVAAALEMANNMHRLGIPTNRKSSHQSDLEEYVYS